MKYLYYILILVLYTQSTLAQEVSNTLKIHDTRDIYDTPNFVKHGIRADFKLDYTIGIPINNYSTNLTISPWEDNSGGLVHQLNFNGSGISYRTGTYQPAVWANWKKIVISDLEGNIGGRMGLLGDLYLGGNPGLCNGYGNKLYLRGVGDQWDDIILAKYSIIENQTELRIILGDDYLGDDKFTIGNHKFNESTWYPFLTVQNDGKVGVKNHFPQYELDVNGTIRAREIKVESGGADFVFDESYKLPTLEEVSSHIKEHKHLPDIPSANEVVKNGMNIGDMNVKLLQKIEELTLYTIQQQESIKSLQHRIEKLESIE